jgi:NAD-dependent SIR2 family protein deacetylase
MGSGSQTSTGPAGIDQALDVVRSGGTLALTGAGVSTDSGIPDYRGPGKPVRNPMSYSEFVGSPAARQRYWARAHAGWGRIANARPNAAHLALARLERMGVVTGVITQNVDGLHTDAGTKRLVELHGRLHDVVCLSCGNVSSREEVGIVLDRLNPGFAELGAGRAAPDGDVELADAEVAEFVVADCQICGGILKPDVVFFGENVPVERVRRAYGMVDAAEALLVVGTSLTVHSGRRFVTRASERGIPVVIVNRGPTRADHLARVRVSGGAGQVLRGLVQRLNQVDGVGRAS